jgi:uncharacterized protein YndB with AHSA1/START domain
MPKVTRRRVIRADPDALWEVVSDPHHLPRWWPGVQRVEEATATAWTKVMLSPQGKTVRADFTRLRAEPGRNLVWRQEVVESPFERILSEAVTEIVLEPAGDESTLVELQATQRLRGFARFGGFMVRRATRRRLDQALDGLELVAGSRP